MFCLSSFGLFEDFRIQATTAVHEFTPFNITLPDGPPRQFQTARPTHSDTPMPVHPASAESRKVSRLEAASLGENFRFHPQQSPEPEPPGHPDGSLQTLLNQPAVAPGVQQVRSGRLAGHEFRSRCIGDEKRIAVAGLAIFKRFAGNPFHQTAQLLNK